MDASPLGMVATRGWIIGWHEGRLPVPSCLKVPGLKHALRLLSEFALDNGPGPPSGIFSHDGKKAPIDSLLKWFGAGDIGFYANGLGLHRNPATRAPIVSLDPIVMFCFSQDPFLWVAFE